MASPRSFLAALAAVAAVSSVAVACTPPPAPLLSGHPNLDSARPCLAAAVASCALPFPSDELTEPDPSTPTGRRVHIPEGLIPKEGLATLGPGARLSDVEDGADGFSSVGPVFFELDRGVDPSSMPADGGDVLRVFDVGTGRPVPIRAEVWADSARQGRADTVVAAWPVLRWEPGHTYIARLRRGLSSPWGPPSRAPGMDRGAWMASIRSELTELEGDRWADTLSATRFTVRSQRSATERFDAMVAGARASDHPVRGITVRPAALIDGAAAVVEGEVSLSDYRDSDGVARPANGPTPTWERFMLVLPDRPAGPAGAPVVVYGHGLLIFKESMLTVASTNARLGLATIGVDVPNHGQRSDEGGALVDLTNPAGLGRLVSMPLQGEIDTVSLVSAIRHHLGGLDVVTAGGSVGSDRIPDLDVDRLLYEGTSMGGVLGAASTTALPELSGAFLQVPGSGIADILYHSLLWPIFQGVVPAGLSAGDAAAVEGAATLLLDPAENANVVTRHAASRFPLFVQYGVGDQTVPNVDTTRLIALTGIPLVGPVLAPPGVEVARTGSPEIPADGRGAVQVLPDGPPELASIFGHLSFMKPEAVGVLEAWLRNRIGAMGLTPEDPRG